MIGIFNALSIISDIVSISQGNIPLGSVVQMIPGRFAKKKKGMSRSQSKKKMIMLKRQRMRRLVDTVIAPKEKKLQRERLEARINEEKAKIDKKKKSSPSLSRPNSTPKRTKRAQNQRPSPNPRLEKYRKKYGNSNEGENEDKNEHVSMTQHIINQSKENKGIGFADQANKNRNDDDSSNSRQS